MQRERTITNKLDLGNGYVSYEQIRLGGKRIVTLRLNGKSLGCLTNPMVNHQVAAQMMLRMATYDIEEKAEPIEATVSEAAMEWNEEQSN